MKHLVSQRSVLRVNVPKKTGPRSARAHIAAKTHSLVKGSKIFTVTCGDVL
jgi:hypothetical protein